MNHPIAKKQKKQTLFYRAGRQQLPRRQPSNFEEKKDNNKYNKEDEEYPLLTRTRIIPTSSSSQFQRRSRARSRKINNRLFVSVDFETIDVDVWWSVSFVMSTYPAGDVISTKQFFVNRTDLYKSANESITQFWRRNPRAFEYNDRNAEPHNNIAVVERTITEFVRKLKRETPEFFLVSDSPAFDVRLLDDILRRNNESPVSLRAPGKHRPSFDSWSYSVAVAHVLGVRVRDIKQHQVAKLSKEETREVDVYCDSVDMQTGGVVAHTALFDCCKILSNYFALLDVTGALGESEIKINFD
jgi:hypothetical protein